MDHEWGMHVVFMGHVLGVDKLSHYPDSKNVAYIGSDIKNRVQMLGSYSMQLYSV